MWLDMKITPGRCLEVKRRTNIGSLMEAKKILAQFDGNVEEAIKYINSNPDIGKAKSI